MTDSEIVFLFLSWLSFYRYSASQSLKRISGQDFCQTRSFVDDAEKSHCKLRTAHDCHPMRKCVIKWGEYAKVEIRMLSKTILKYRAIEVGILCYLLIYKVPLSSYCTSWQGGLSGRRKIYFVKFQSVYPRGWYHIMNFSQQWIMFYCSGMI